MSFFCQRNSFFRCFFFTLCLIKLSACLQLVQRQKDDNHYSAAATVTDPMKKSQMNRWLTEIKRKIRAKQNRTELSLRSTNKKKHFTILEIDTHEMRSVYFYLSCFVWKFIDFRVVLENLFSIRLRNRKFTSSNSVWYSRCMRNFFSFTENNSYRTSLKEMQNSTDLKPQLNSKYTLYHSLITFLNSTSFFFV